MRAGGGKGSRVLGDRRDDIRAVLCAQVPPGDLSLSKIKLISSQLSFFHQSKENCTREVDDADYEHRRAEDESAEDLFGHSGIERWRRKVWNLTEFPQSSTAAKVIII